IFGAYRYFELYWLFNEYLPLPDNLRLPASLLVSVILVSSLLVFGCHIDQFKLSKYGSGDWIKRVLLSFNLILGFYFWKAYSDDGASTQLASFLAISFKLTIVLLFGLIEYCYNHLFIKLHTDQSRAMQFELDKSQLEQELSELEQTISKQKQILSDLIRRDDSKVCKRCGQQFSNHQQANAHLRTCTEMINLN
ncbi:hypothetical protein, partial [Reichenbachiella sp.]|uniref:hypothetical protein n=1 Tax=Reichenbachiella sp. TaxID=2184521 RepID=UPI003296B56D